MAEISDDELVARMVEAIERMPDGLRTYLTDVAATARDEAAKRFRWIGQFTDLVRSLHAGEAIDWPARALFWIRLHAIRVELIPMYQTWKDAVPTARPDSKLVARGVAVHDAAVALCARLTADEWLVADYLRHDEAHLTVNSFRVGWRRRDGQARTTLRVGDVQKPIADTDAERERVLAQNEGPIGFARMIATKVAQDAEQLRRAVETESFTRTY